MEKPPAVINVQGGKKNEIFMITSQLTFSNGTAHKLRPRYSNSDQTYPTDLTNREKINETMIFRQLTTGHAGQ